MKQKNLLILGAGQYGRVVRETAQAMGCFGEIAFLDDNSSVAIGKFADYEHLTSGYQVAVVALGDLQLRLLWLDNLARAGFEVPVLIHPKAYVSPSARVGSGTIVEPRAVINTEAVVGSGCLVCAGAVINHNSVVQCGCKIDCNAVVAANTVVPEGTKVKAGTVYEKK